MAQNTDTAWLSFYLRDHMAAATAGVDLFDRVARGHSDDDVRTQVARPSAQVKQDHTSLSRIMTNLGSRQCWRNGAPSVASIFIRWSFS